MEILRRQVSTLADVLRKSEWVSVWSGLHKNFKGLKKDFTNSKKTSVSCPYIPRPIRPYHFQADLIWLDSPFNED